MRALKFNTNTIEKFKKMDLSKYYNKNVLNK